MKLKAYGIRGEGSARQPCPLDRALALLDVLLASAAVVVEGDDALGRVLDEWFEKVARPRLRGGGANWSDTLMTP
jgi:hypothetical protein